MKKKYTPLYFVKRVVLIVGLSAAVGLLYFKGTYNPVACVIEGVEDYDPARDKQHIINLFNEDHYWLTVNDDYDIEHMLNTHSPNKYETRYFGKMPIKVIRDNGQVAAWSTYYMRSIYEGKILFVDVHPEYRKKRYARRLMQFAECDLRRQGAHKVTLATRTSNKAAQVAYERMGYTKSGISEGFVYYEKKLK